MKIYFNFNDWYIGYYRGSNYHFFVIMTLVFQWNRKKKENIELELLGMPIFKTAFIDPDKIYLISNAQPYDINKEELVNKINNHTDNLRKYMVMNPETMKRIIEASNWKWPNGS